MNKIEKSELDVLEREYHNKYRIFHRGLDDEMEISGYDGSCMFPQLYILRTIIRNNKNNFDITSFLDYGCGRAYNYTKYKLHHYFLTNTEINPSLYDPGYEPYSLLPSGEFDMVLSLDVMEHIPEPLIDKNLNNIFSRAKKLVILGISTKKSIHLLHDGENAHCTVKDKYWWFNKILPHIKNSSAKPYVIFNHPYNEENAIYFIDKKNKKIKPINEDKENE